MQRLAMIALLVSGCLPPCEDAPLAPPASPPAFLVELTEHGSPAQSDGEATRRESRSALALYGADGAIVQDHWVGTDSPWDDARGRIDGRDAIPTRQAPGQVTLLLDEPASVVTLEPASGSLLRDLLLSAGGPPRDFVEVGGVGLIARADGLATIDLERGATRRVIDLSARVGSESVPGRLAPFAEETVTRVAVGLPRADLGAVAIVEVATGATTLLELPSLRGCAEVSPMHGTDGPAQVAVLCGGDPETDPDLRDAAGVAILEAEPGQPVRVARIRNVTSRRRPTHALVGAAGGWVAMLSRGEASVRPDALLALNVESGEVVTLREERWSPRYGAPLGEGAFNPVSGELWWPSVRDGIVRFRLESAGFVESDNLATPTCSPLPARRVRHLP